MQNDDVPKKKAPGSIPPAPARSNPRSKPRRIQEAIQGAVEAKAHNSISGAVKAPIEGTPGRTASILDAVRKER